jgi:hypothetical protein
MIRRCFVAFFILSGIAALGGCSQPDKGFVQKGSVTLEGKPLTSGIVRFHMAGSRLANAVIQPDGTFEATEAIPGEAKVTVEDDLSKHNQTMPGPKAGAGPPKQLGVPEAPPKAIPIPVKYKDVAKSGLVFTLSPGTPLEIKLDK